MLFVPGVLPGERVRARVLPNRRGAGRAELIEVLDAAPGRVEPPCPHVERGCGGCGWQHIALETQTELRRAIVADALARIARIDEAPLAPSVVLPADGYRTTVRGSVDRGRLAFHRRRGNELIAVDSCLVAHPLVNEIIRDGAFRGATEVEIRVGERTGERMVFVDPSAEQVEVPDGVKVVGLDEVAAGRSVWIRERVIEEWFRISAPSFFQVRPDGADVLATLVRDAARGVATGRAIDLYAGVGLFAKVLARDGWRVKAVEGDRFAAADAAENLHEFGTSVTASEVAKWKPTHADFVVADPSRSGLGKPGVAAVVGTDAPRVVLVHCDPGSMARDVALMASEGYRLRQITPVDMFVHTPHVETVTVLTRP
ncbi:MAG: class I SAM-dependent RNA methyltransferase [Acidimicrobiia bacterium]